jgi:hypothetical protein
MEYRGVEFTVVQTANPTGWKWTVHLGDGKEKNGECDTRAAGIRFAQRVMDRHVRELAKSS